MHDPKEHQQELKFTQSVLSSAYHTPTVNTSNSLDNILKFKY